MKRYYIVLLLSFGFVHAQTTGFKQDFNDGQITGWKSDHERTFQLSVDSTFLKIDYTRTGTSEPWDNFNLTLPEEVDVSNTPRLYVRARSDVATIVGLKPVPVNPVNVITRSIPGDNIWKDLYFEITNTTNLTVTQIYCYLDGGSTEQKSGTVWFDEIRIGDSLLTLPANFTALELAIDKANALLQSSDEGNGEGEFPSGSKSTLQNEISAATALLGTDLNQTEVDSAANSLYNACSTFESTVNALPVNIVDSKANKQTRYLYLNLQEMMENALLFGMHDATGYGVGWSGDDDRSDVNDVVGDFPAVYSEDLNNITRGTEVDRVRYRLTSAYKKGAVITMCWHQYDPDGRSFYASDIGNEKIVGQIIPGGERHGDYIKKLESVADFFKSLRGENGEAIPVIFRPYHEHTGSWFWWGDGQCTTAEYNELWRFTVHYLQDTLNVHNLLWAISPSFQHLGSGDEYFNIYPGDDYVDIFGADKYFRTNPVPVSEMNQYILKLQTLVAHAETRDKIPALTEISNTNLEITGWFSDILLDPIKNDSLSTHVSYAAVWRNANTDHFHAPYPGHPSVGDFTDFFNDPYTLFESDLPDMYVLPEEDLNAPLFTEYPEEHFVSPSTNVEINIQTDERAFLRWDYVDQDYDAMANQFQIGERDFDHTTYIETDQGDENTIYIRAVDIYGNKTAESISITFVVDTMEAVITWRDGRYPSHNWNQQNTPMGHGSEADSSIEGVQTAYFIKEFELTSAPAAARTVVQFTGGVAIYINGTEAARVNLPEGAELNYETEATASSKTTKSITFSEDIVDIMHAGINTIGVEVHGGPAQVVEYFDLLLQTDTETPFSYGADWYYYDLGDMPESFKLGDIVSIQKGNALKPRSPLLYQNYPNPFNPRTTVRYDLAESGYVSLEVFNILGQKIGTLVNNNQNAGTYQVEFNSSGLASGVYIYVLRTEKTVQKHKMLILK